MRKRPYQVERCGCATAAAAQQALPLAGEVRMAAAAVRIWLHGAAVRGGFDLIACSRT
jgi:hypothetical protein